jgi:hypothetical protein
LWNTTSERFSNQETREHTQQEMRRIFFLYRTYKRKIKLRTGYAAWLANVIKGERPTRHLPKIILVQTGTFIPASRLFHEIQRKKKLIFNSFSTFINKKITRLTHKSTSSVAAILK